MSNGVTRKVTRNAAAAAMSIAITTARLSAARSIRRGEQPVGDDLEPDGAARLHEHRVAGLDDRRRRSRRASAASAAA